jgi:ATP-binding cassette subfamily B (MDR/TAP) protein 1
MTRLLERYMCVFVNFELIYSPSSTDTYFQLDGKKLTDLNVREYRKHLALVSQEPTLYCGTIRFNILLGAIKPHSEVTQDEIDAACRDAHILDFIQNLPRYAFFFQSL